MSTQSVTVVTTTSIATTISYLIFCLLVSLYHLPKIMIYDCKAIQLISCYDMWCKFNIQLAFTETLPHTRFSRRFHGYKSKRWTYSFTPRLPPTSFQNPNISLLYTQVLKLLSDLTNCAVYSFCKLGGTASLLLLLWSAKATEKFCSKPPSLKSNPPY